MENSVEKEKKYISVQCNCESALANKCADDILSICFPKEENRQLDDLNYVNESSAVKFCIENSVVPQILLKTLHENHRILSFNLTCDAKKIEIFGDHDVYIATVDGSVPKDCEDLPVYEYVQKFSDPVAAITLKFVRPVSDCEFCVYGMQLVLSDRLPTAGLIDYQRVARMLTDVKVSLSAEPFMAMASSMKSSNTSRHGDDIGLVLDEVKGMRKDFFRVCETINQKLDRALELLERRA